MTTSPQVRAMFEASVAALTQAFGPVTPAEAERAERERVARKRPHLALVGNDPRPDPDMYRWWSIDELMERSK